MSSSKDVINWRQRTKENSVKVMGEKCALCGLEGEMIEIYDFHHLNPKEKNNSISGMIKNSTSWETICNELRKCVLLCANCHRKVEYSKETIIFNKTSFKEDIYQKIIEEKEHKHKCIDCGISISPRAIRCQSCSSKYKTNRTIDEIPTRIELKDLIRSNSMISIGKIFNVSDNAIRKWCIKRNLPSKKTEINAFTEEEWNNI